MLVSLSYLMFVAPGRSDPPALLYSLVPLLIWAALRFGSAGVGASATVVALMSIWGAIHGRGPFTEADPLNRVLSLQIILTLHFHTFHGSGSSRRRAENCATLSFGQSEERLRLSMESGKAVGWEWNLKTGRDSWFGDLKTMFGIPAERFVGRPEDFHRYFIRKIEIESQKPLPRRGKAIYPTRRSSASFGPTELFAGSRPGGNFIIRRVAFPSACWACRTMSRSIN